MSGCKVKELQNLILFYSSYAIFLCEPVESPSLYSPINRGLSLR